MKDPRAFLKLGRQEIPRRKIDERLKDWLEVELSPKPEVLSTQSQRCMDCGVAFCQGDHGCPVNNLIPEWNELVSQNRWQDAAARLHMTNNFPEFTSRLCPAPCESACVLGIHSKPVSIKSLEWGIIERAFENDWVKPHAPSVKSEKRVAIIGSGPAGLAAAQQLVRCGHRVSVFEKSKAIGGLLRYGIPDFKLSKSVIDRRLLQLVDEGVEFHTGVHFGVDLQYHELDTHYDAIILATGADIPRDLNVRGRELSGIHFAMDYLTEQNQFLNHEISEIKINAFGKKVIILGGGDTGSDCLGTALRQSASQVLQFEIQPKPPSDRDPSTPWPFWPMKLKSSHAHEEGGLREWNLSTTEFVGSERVEALRARRLDQNEELLFEADLVILALGFTGASTELQRAIPQLKFNPRGQIATSNQFQTGLEKLFACGDNRRGASLIVWAIAEGRQVARAVDQFLKIRHPI